MEDVLVSRSFFCTISDSVPAIISAALFYGMNHEGGKGDI